MPRPKKKKEKPRQDGQFEYKATIGKNMNGTLIRKSFYSSISKDDAKSKADEFIIEKRAAEIAGVNFVVSKTGFDAWAMKWLELYKKPFVEASTYRDTYLNVVKNHLIPYFGSADLKTIQPADVQAFLSSKKKYSQSQLHKIKITLAAIFDAAIENDLCYKNPTKSKTIKAKSEQIKKPKRVYKSKDIKVVYSLIDLNEARCVLDTGARTGEICGLMWSDYNPKEGIIEINRAVANVPGGGLKIKAPKWDSRRTIPLSDRGRRLLDGLPHVSPYIFPNRKGNPQSPKCLERKLSRRMKHLPPEIDRLTMHELRHTYGTDLRRKKVDIFTIQKVMGHKDIKVTTETYVKNEVDQLKKNMRLAGRKTRRYKVKNTLSNVVNMS